MPIEFQCSGCRKTLRVPDDSAGKSARCPECGNVVTIPAAAALPTTDSPFAAGTGPALNPYSSPQVASFQPAPPAATGIVGNQPVDVGQVLNYAWEIWKANLGLLVGVFVAVMGVSYALAFALGGAQVFLEQNNNQELAAGIAILGNLVSSAIQIFLGIGQAQIALKLVRGQPASFSDLFGGAPRFLPVLGASILGGLALGVGFVLCLVPGIILALMIWPFYFLVVDEKSTVFDSFSVASRITEGNRGTTFLLWLLSFGIMAVGMLALCIGIIFAGPLVSVLWATAYLMMSGQVVVKPTHPGM